MDMTLDRELVERYVCAAQASAGREISEEAVVPDTLPDVGTVIDAQGMLWVRGKDMGEGQVTLTASVSLSVLYAPPEGGGLRSVELELPAELRLETPGADSDCRVRADLRLISAEARALNSRKIAVRAEIAGSVSCWRRESVTVTAGCQGRGIYVRREETAVMPVSDVREKTFAVTDEYAVPAGLSGGVRVIARRVGAQAEDVKYAAGKVIVRGSAVSELVFADDAGNVRTGRFSSAFSQIMELDSAAEEAQCAASLLLTGAYFDLPEFGEGAGRCQAELHFALQVLQRERRTAALMTDVYANTACLVPAFEELPAVLEARPLSMRQTVAGRAEPGGEGETLLLSASVGAVSLEGDTVKTSVLIRMASRSAEGAWTPSKCRLSAEFTPAELREGFRLTDVRVYAADVYGAGQDVRAVLQMDALLLREGSLRFVSAAEEDPEAFQSRPRVPSVTLVRAKPGTDLWELAKRCGSSVEAIGKANEGRAEGLLLVPKARENY